MMRDLIAAYCICVVATAFLATAGDTPEKPWSFAVVADNRGGGKSHRVVMKSVQAGKHEMILNLGDMVHPSKGHHWEDFLADMKAVFGDQTQAMLKRYYVTPGGWEEQYMNRSRRAEDPPITQADWKYAGKFSCPGYEPDNKAGQAFAEKHFNYRERAAKKSEFVDYDEYGDYHITYRNIHILSIYLSDEWRRTEKFGPHDDPKARALAWEKQVSWLETRLKSIRASSPDAAIVVMGHDAGWVAQSGNSFRGRLCELMAKYRVDIAFCGDGHKYRVYPDPTTLKFMAPACLGDTRGGYMSVTVEGSKLTVKHCRRDGRILEAFQKKAGKPLRRSAESSAN